MYAGVCCSQVIHELFGAAPFDFSARWAKPSLFVNLSIYAVRDHLSFFGKYSSIVSFAASSFRAHLASISGLQVRLHGYRRGMPDFVRRVNSCILDWRSRWSRLRGSAQRVHVASVSGMQNGQHPNRASSD